MLVVGTVAESFSISGRGVGVLFKESPEHIRHLPKLEVVVARPNGTTASFTASREFARKLDSQSGEVVALVVVGASVQVFPVGSVVSVSGVAAI
jgi:hypothetical protein